MNISEELERQVLLLLAQNRKVEAIKLVVDHTHCGLKNAKDYVDGMAPSKTYNAVKPIDNASMDKQLILLLAKGDKLGAIKLYKDATGQGLAQSKNYIDELQQRGFTSAPQLTETKGKGFKTNKRETEIDGVLTNHSTKEKSGCFVATVCYGNYEAQEVLVLRRYRDQRLMQTLWGRGFVKFYYVVSPFIARQMDRSALVKSAVRKYILEPV